MTIADKLALLADTKEKLRQRLGLSLAVPFGEYVNALPFKIEFLFLSEQIGFLPDYSDKSTLFKDASGTQSVTADGDPVGLILDKSEGLELGSELVVNGNFNTDVSSWVGNKAGANISWESGKARLDFNSLGDAGITQVINQPSGFCEVTVSITSQFTGAFGMGVSLPNSGTGDVAFAFGQQKTLRFISYRTTAGTAALLIRTASGVPTGYFIVDNVSIREIKGNHARQTVSAQRPLYKTDGINHWLYHDKVDDKLLVRLPAMTATVVAATDDGVTINYPVSIAAGDYTLLSASTLGRDYGRLIINKGLSAAEQAQVTKYLNDKRGV